MTSVFFWIAAVDCLLAAFLVTRLLVGLRRIAFLRDHRVSAETTFPRVSIVVAARNEERGIEPALRSLLAQDYPDYELIVVNDRSTDGTGALLDQLVQQHSSTTRSAVRVVTVEELPAGWLGKNHALQLGTEQADGELLLFTDADIVMAPDAVRRGVDYLQHHQLDHLTIAPQAVMPGLVLNCFVAVFMSFFSTLYQPWKARDPKSKRYVGIGAFNLVRSDVYRAIDGHRPIAMRPDDDVKLGKLIKRSGYSQEMVNGTDLVSVEWYSSVWETVVGLEKNSFAAVGYQAWVVVLSTLLILTLDLWPFAAIFLTAGVTRWMYLAVIASLLTLTATNARLSHANPLCTLLFPVVILLILFISWRSMLLTYWNDGIRWRDTHYSLAELRANKY